MVALLFMPRGARRYLNGDHAPSDNPPPQLDSPTHAPHPIHRRYYAEDLVRQRRASERRRQVSSQRRGRVDPNPHQIDAVMFALRRIPEGGCILADEVGLGKTIEAGLVIAQLLAEGATRILIVVPRPLLGQWQAELVDLFDIDAVEARRSVGRRRRGGRVSRGARVRRWRGRSGAPRGRALGPLPDRRGRTKSSPGFTAVTTGPASTTRRARRRRWRTESAG